MKKNIMIMMVLVLSVVGAKAQEVENPVGRFSVIPRIGVAIANLSDNSIYLLGTNQEIKSKVQAGLMVGVDMEYRASELLGVSLGAYYARQGARWGDYEERMDINSGETNEEGKYYGYKNKHLNLDYIHVPLMLKVYVAPQFALMAGAQMGFLCGDGKEMVEITPLTKDKDGSTWYEETVEAKSSYSAKKVDFSIPIGVSYEYMNVILDARYNIGVTKVNKDDISNSKNKTFTFTVGYRFSL